MIQSVWKNLTGITCMHSFKAALIAFSVTSWLNYDIACTQFISRFDMK